MRNKRHHAKRFTPKVYPIPSDTDTEMSLQICERKTIDSLGKEISRDYVIGILLSRETGADGDGEQYTALTIDQAYNLKRQLEAIIPSVETLNIPM